MRTTVDIDPRVLAAARARVNAGINKSLVVPPSTSGQVITDEMVAEALLDD